MSLPFTSPAAVFFVVYLAILAAPLLAERLRLPGIVGLVMAGLLIGPAGLGLLAREGLVEQLGGAGILYLMFLAGVELDVNAIGRRKDMVVLSVATFVLPLTLGIVGGVATGYSGLAAVLLGSLWASHTLIVYPLVRRYALQRSRAVSATVAATVVTDTLALLVLAVVAQLHVSGRFSFGLATELVAGGLVLGGVTLYVLPRLVRWLLRGIGQDRPVRMLIVLLGAFGGALVAEAVGIEAIIGSFFAGLSLSRLVPRGGVLLERLELLGTGLFIPVFLLSVGMLVDVRVIVQGRTLLLGAVFTAAALVGKAGAAVIAGRLSGYDRNEIGLVFALSSAQAAATLAATVVGLEVGLFDEETVHAVLIVILVTVVLASWTGQRVMPRLSGARIASDLGERVLVPVANPEHAEVHVEFAGRLAMPDRGIVMPLHVVVGSGVHPGGDLDETRTWLSELEGVGYRSGVEAHARIRLDASVARGVARSVAEADASAVVLGWSADRAFGALGTSSIVEEVVGRSPVPVIAVLERGLAPRRIVLALTAEDLAASSAPSLTAASSVAVNLAASGRPCVVLAPDDVAGMNWVLGRLGRAEVCFDPSGRGEALATFCEPGDVVVMPAGTAGTRSLSREFYHLADELGGSTLVVVFGPHTAGPLEPTSLGVVRLDEPVGD